MTICPYCTKEFHSLGIMRHRTACREKFTKNHKLEEKLNKEIEKGVIDKNEYQEYETLIKFENEKENIEFNRI